MIVSFGEASILTILVVKLAVLVPELGSLLLSSSTTDPASDPIASIALTAGCSIPAVLPEEYSAKPGIELWFTEARGMLGKLFLEA